MSKRHGWTVHVTDRGCVVLMIIATSLAVLVVAVIGWIMAGIG